jgi:uncharacterized coiled-coil protein SlyX
MPVMSKQYNKFEKRKRRVAYLKRRRKNARTKAAAKPEAPAPPPA